MSTAHTSSTSVAWILSIFGDTDNPGNYLFLVAHTPSMDRSLFALVHAQHCFIEQISRHRSLNRNRSERVNISRLPINTLKIDRAFIMNMTNKPDDLSIVSTIISLAHSLELQVVAECVETEEQANLLRLLKCDQFQGYLYSPAVPVEQIEILLQIHESPPRSPG